MKNIREINELKVSLKEKKQEIKILKQITQTIYNTLNLDLILKKTIKIASNVTKCDACLIYLLDKKRDELILQASKNPHPKIMGKIKLKMGEGITGWAANEKKPVIVPKNASKDPRFKFFHNLPEDKYQAILSVPIISKNNVVGVINIRHKNTHNYDDNIVSLLFTIATQIGGAIENAHLYEETRKKTREIEALSKISNSVVSNNYLDEILNLIVTITAEMMGSKICSIMILDERKEELIIKSTQSLSEGYRNKPNLKIGQSISGQVVKKKKPIVVLDVTKEPGYMYPEIAKKEGLFSMLAVPMMIKDRVIGVINSYTSEKHKFSKEEIKILQAVANQAAITIENTKLMGEAVKAREALEERKLIERAKGILMQEFKLAEDMAYRKLHRKSMDSRRTMKEVAEAVIITLGRK